MVYSKYQHPQEIKHKNDSRADTETEQQNMEKFLQHTNPSLTKLLQYNENDPR